MNTTIQSLLDFGNRGIVVSIECHLSNNLPNIVIVGFANRAVDEARERVRSAFASSGLQLPRKRITINLAPADIPKDSSSFDLPIAAAIMQSAKLLPDGNQLEAHEAVMGELGLDGSVRPIRGIIGKILAGRERGINTFYIPAANMAQAQLVPGVRLVAVTSLKEFVERVSSQTDGATLTHDLPDESANSLSSPDDIDPETLGFQDIVGQTQAKRALQIAAAGGHNILLSGPPGTGKSMLARALATIMPPLDIEEMLEVTHLHSLASREYDQIITKRPFRSPHHTASLAAIVGGGASIRPGEISLAHHGVLFFDEFPEFQRPTIEALRQPLEDHRITIARAQGSLEFPADFILVATANPCPCGYYGTDRAAKRCQCPSATIQNYRSRLSGPILDRIDLYAEVQEVEHAHLIPRTGASAVKSTRKIIKEYTAQIRHARRLQIQRHGAGRLNASMTNHDIARHACLERSAKELLDTAANGLDLSARAYMRTIKVARTIADLEDSARIKKRHITEALQYRSRPSYESASSLHAQRLG